MNTSDIYKEQIALISNPFLRQAVVDTLNEAPECIQVIPASSSGKYHSEGDCMTGYVDESGVTHTGGLVNHTKSVVAIANELFRAFDYDDEDKDCILAACIVHDCMKPDLTAEHRTRFDHPLLASDLFKKNAEKYCDKDVRMDSMIRTICNAIESHMGKFNTSIREDIVLPIPVSAIERFVHLCDYIASRRFINVDLTKYTFERVTEDGV